ncbi:MAG: hypothetical protein GXY83_38860 [Rhodopirellula sp.]|nr:hypothetical protein [Rhodopirellula sp.]
MKCFAWWAACVVALWTVPGLLAEEATPKKANASTTEAMDLLQSAALHAARGENAEAEGCCRKLLDNPDLLRHVDSLKVRSLLGTCLRKLKRHDEAFETLKGVLKEQREQLGEDSPEVKSTVGALDGLTIDMTWPQATKVNRPPQEYDAAIAVAEEAAALRLTHSRWQLALLKLRHGDRAAGLEWISKSLTEDNNWLGQFSILAMALWENGNQQLARDAHAVVCDRTAKTKDVWEPIKTLRDQATEQLKIGEADPAKQMSREDLVAAYSRLIEAYPGVGRLHGWRANHLGCLGRSDDAVRDMAKASELEPENWRFGEGLAVLRLATAGAEEQTKICRELWDDSLKKEKYGTRGGDMDLVLLCSLAGDAELDRKMILDRADEILARTPTRPFLELSRGMALYRCGRYEEAFDVLPSDDSPYGNLKDRGLAIIFRAMTHHKLGDKFAAKRLLESARKLHADEFSASPVVRMPYQDAAVVDSMIRIALKETEALITKQEI